MHYYQFNIADYRKDTSHLSMLEHGAYRQLIDLYYLNEAPISADKNIIFRLFRAKTKKEKFAIEIILKEFFILTETGWVHKRCNEEILKYSEKADVSRKNGKYGGRPKKTQQVISDNPTETQSVILGNPEETQSEPSEKLTNNHKPITNNQEPKTTTFERGSKTLKELGATEEKNPTRSKTDHPALQKIQTQIPKPFTADERARLLSNHFNLDLNVELEMFIAHYEANGETRDDWNACFRKWLMRSMQMRADVEKRSQSPPENPRKLSKFSGFDYINGGDGYGGKREEVIEGQLASELPQICGEKAN